MTFKKLYGMSLLNIIYRLEIYIFFLPEEINDVLKVIEKVVF